MNMLARQPMTLAQFLDWEDRQELRYEFDGFQPIATTGGTQAHAAIQVNLITALNIRLRGKPCRPYGSELKILVAGRIRYPDAFVMCTRAAPQAKVVSEPVVIFEILSESTAKQDLVIKNGEYRDTPSVLRYVILQQDAAAAQVFVRKEEASVSELLSSAEVLLRMPEIGIDIPMAELYADVELPLDSHDDET